MIAAVWKQKGYSGTIDYKMTNALALHFWAGVQQGFGSNGIDYNTPDWNMLASLQRDVWHFAAAKNYQQLRELTAALLDEEGNLRSKRDFITAAQGIVDKTIARYLSAEYELAVAGSQMASKWVDIIKDKDTLPWLTFDAVLDGQTTELCASLNGTSYRYDHPFWSVYYPPNHFNCRSTARRSSSGVASDSHATPEIPRMFRTNLAAKGLIFPPDHPYFVDNPKLVNDKAMAVMRKELLDTAKSRLIGKSIAVKDLGNVEFSTLGLKEMLNQPHSRYFVKNQLVTVSDQLLKNATLIKSVADSKGRIKSFHYLRVAGLNDMFLVVKEDFKGKYTMYSIVEAIK